MLELVKDFVFKFPNGKSKIKKLNKENLWLKGDNDNDVRKIMAYPSKVETLKGVGGDIIIVRCRCRCRCVTFASPLLVLPAQCEEAAAMDMKGTWDFCARERDRRALVAGASVRFRGASAVRSVVGSSTPFLNPTESRERFHTSDPRSSVAGPDVSLCHRLRIGQTRKFCKRRTTDYF